jgi:hypothetical protein
VSERKGGELGVKGMRLQRKRGEASKGWQCAREKWRRSGTREIETPWLYESVNGVDGYGFVGGRGRRW